MINKRGHMDTTSRAKQFAPFAALKGHEMELAKQLEHKDEKIILAEDEIERINHILIDLNKGDSIKATYYANNVYTTIVGTVEKIYVYDSAIQVKGTKIFLADIYRIEKLDI